jgi:predicted RecA/RadA family phage recombinase
MPRVVTFSPIAPGETSKRRERILAHARAVLDGFAEMSVALDAEPGDEADGEHRRLAERVPRATADRGDDGIHAAWFSSATDDSSGGTLKHLGGAWNRRVAAAESVAVPLNFTRLRAGT